MNTGEELRNARKDRELLQSQVAEQIPMNRSNCSKIERGVREPGMEQLWRICQILKLDPAYLLGWDPLEPVSQKDRQLLAEAKVLIKRYRGDK